MLHECGLQMYIHIYLQIFVYLQIHNLQIFTKYILQIFTYLFTNKYPKARSEHETPKALRGAETEYGPMSGVPGELQ